MRFLRSALAGEKVTGEYETFSVSKFRLARAADPVPSIMLAALRPGMLRLAAEETDGASTNWLAASGVPKVHEVVGPDFRVSHRGRGGRVESCREQVRSYVDNGLTTPVLPTGGDVFEQVRGLAPPR
ncbi:Luciferase-like monooxygenase [Amycolatopsis sp. M39]|nr:Luciferase-like monooxygenase [Amycolatopsis sp. M39]